MRINRLLGIGLSLIFLVPGILLSWLLFGGPYFRIGLILLVTGIIGLGVTIIRKPPALSASKEPERA
jgi:hypothetical protein